MTSSGWTRQHRCEYRQTTVQEPWGTTVCLKTLDDVQRTRTQVVITKRGHPVAKLVPYLELTTRRSLAGSVVREVGDPYGTGERWDGDAS